MTEIPIQSPPEARFHPTWWMLAASTVASVGLATNGSGKSVALPILFIAIAASYFLRARMPAGGLTPWIVRGVLFALVILTSDEHRTPRIWYADSGFMALVGACLLAELAVQHFLPVHVKNRLGQMLVLTTGILACGSATVEPRFIAVIAPLYLICILGVLHAFKPAATTSPLMNSQPPSRTSRRWMLHGSAIVLAVTLGFAGGAMLRAFYTNFGNFGMTLIEKLLPTRTMGGMTGNERLGGNYNFGESTGRKLKITGTNRMMYLRGLAFDRYRSGGWRPDFKDRQWDVVSAFPAPAAGKTFRIERLEDGLDLLYLPLEATGFSTPKGSTNQADKANLAVFQSATGSGDVMRYTVGLGQGPAYQGPLCTALADRDRATMLEVPDDIEDGVRELAKGLRHDDPQATIRSTVFHLQDQHEYSLKSSFHERDPVSAFLLSKKAAHCQFFASGAAILLRLNGVPCRYVTGYVAHEATSSDSMVVRGRDAHAWVEAWVDGVGWITVEATPASGTPEGKTDSVGLYQRIKDFLSDVISMVGQFVRSLRWHHIAIAGGLVVAIAVAVQSMRNWKARKKRPAVRFYTFPHEEYRTLAVEFELLLKSMGDPPSGSATWSEHLMLQREQTRRSGRQARLDAAGRFVDEYNQSRFGRPVDGESLEHLKTLLNEVKES